MSEFKRETRYAVFKLKNLTDEQKQRLYDLRMELGPWNDVKECVIVESDWANYADTWAAVQEVSEGRYVPRAHQNERAEVAEFFIENLGLHIDAGADIYKITALLVQWLDADHGERLAEVRADAIEAASNALYNAGIADEAASDWLVLYAAKVRGGLYEL